MDQPPPYADQEVTHGQIQYVKKGVILGMKGVRQHSVERQFLFST